ncbi:maltose/moltooligosaccharide transporter [Povalibacter uvarum]|uniref:Maltose/moltooligosaccharide transporter n=1 Tax=Povalibacter uvarum TaxID=732238 RepID=A0A841HUJ5_9GAMM|nr:MFS transporter [Povalibacter uvarum]MBB6095939.1 maltose/moltooligosaccharide transporter [Povalibacter uvarum]
MTSKPRVSFWQIWNMCFGFLGIQFGFALQNANVSRIFQTLGADVNEIPILWIAAPLTGLIVQPIVGYYSDRTWNRLGRRRPYFLFGAILTTLALFVMPNSPTLWIAAGVLWILDASINVSMEPFRAFVGDQLPPKQRAAGYAMQSFFIGIGAVVASLLPWILARFGVENTAEAGAIPDTVKYAFYAGGAILFAAVGWTVFSTREYPPDVLNSFDDAGTVEEPKINTGRARRDGVLWLMAGVLAVALIYFQSLEAELYLLAAGLIVYGIALLVLSAWQRRNAFTAIMSDLHEMPPAMRRLAVVQFFSWFALFAMWIYTTSGVTQVHYGTTDPQSAAYNEGANWVGVLFAAYSGFAAIAAIVIPFMVRGFGLRVSHLINLWLGALGLASFVFIRDPQFLIVAMIGVGFAWASIVSLPYALLSNNLPAAKMGVYMGIFNFFIVIPQLLAASVLGFMLRAFAGGQPIYALVIGGASLFIAGLAVLRVANPQAEHATTVPAAP